MSSPRTDSFLTGHQRIADMLGVSRSTVSRALQNSSRISPGTRARVAEAARQMDYRPNPLVTALMERIRNRRKETFVGKIAVLSNPEEAGEGHCDPRWSPVFIPAQRYAQERGFELETFNVREHGGSGRRLATVLAHRGIQGVMLTSGCLSSNVVDWAWENFSVASFGSHVAGPRLHKVCHDDLADMQTACLHLFERSHRRIGLYLGEGTDPTVSQRYRAGLSFAQEGRISPERRIAPLIVPSGGDPRTFVEWLAGSRPDAVLSNDARRVVSWAAQAGWVCPRDFSVAQLGEESQPSAFAGIVHSVAHLGKAMVDLVVGQIQRNEVGIPEVPTTLSIGGRWAEGTSVIYRTGAALPP